MNILVINGPNLNLLGKRDKSHYGEFSLEMLEEYLNKEFPSHKFTFYQSNVEGEIINKIHETGFSFDGIILNAGGYTHTSVAIADAITSVKSPVVEVHISNIFAREEYRQVSLIAPKCLGSISGFGLDSYRLAIESLRVINKE